MSFTVGRKKVGTALFKKARTAPLKRPEQPLLRRTTIIPPAFRN